MTFSSAHPQSPLLREKCHGEAAAAGAFGGRSSSAVPSLGCTAVTTPSEKKPERKMLPRWKNFGILFPEPVLYYIIR